MSRYLNPAAPKLNAGQIARIEIPCGRVYHGFCVCGEWLSAPEFAREIAPNVLKIDGKPVPPAPQVPSENEIAAAAKRLSRLLSHE